jgi:hypothetical protein
MSVHFPALLRSFEDGWGRNMRKVEEYRRHAEDCRKLANSVSTEEAKQQLLQMAGTWDDLAKHREDQIARQERIAHLESRNGN